MPEGSRLQTTPRFQDRYATEKNWTIVEGLTAFAAARGHTMLDLAFSWLALQPVVSSVIAGATKPEQIDANVKAVGWKMTAEELAEIDRISRPA